MRYLIFFILLWMGGVTNSTSVPIPTPEPTQSKPVLPIYKSKFYLDGHQQVSTEIAVSDSVNLTIVSSSKHPFSITLYNQKGKPLVFKGHRVSYSGIVNYIDIENIHPEINKIKIYWNIEESDVYLQYLKVALSILSICALFATILLDSQSYVRKILLITIIIFELYISPNYEKIGSLVKKKMLGI